MKDYEIGPWAFGAVAAVAVCGAAVLITLFIAESPEYVSGAYVEESCSRVGVSPTSSYRAELVQYDVVCGQVKNNRVVLRSSVERVPYACPVEGWARGSSNVSLLSYENWLAVQGKSFWVEGSGMPNASYRVEASCDSQSVSTAVQAVESGAFVAELRIPVNATITYTQTLFVWEGPRQWALHVYDDAEELVASRPRAFDVGAAP